VKTVTLKPGSRRLLLDLARARARVPGPAVLASACKILGAERTPDGAFRFHAEGPAKTGAVVRVALPDAPTVVTLDGQVVAAEARAWDPGSRTLLLTFPNAAAGHRVLIH
jgi:hypothetical protein